MNAEPTTQSATRQPADRALMMVTVVSGTILAASCPFLNLGMAGTIAAMVLLLMPYGMLMWRLVRHAGSKEGPGLAIGMGLFVTMAGSLIGVDIRDSNSVIRGANFGEQLWVRHCGYPYSAERTWSWRIPQGNFEKTFVAGPGPVYC